MIKINLIAEKKASTAPSQRRFKLDGLGNSRAYLMSAVLILGFVIAGGWWYTLRSEQADWKDKNLKAEAELKRLEEVRKKGEYYKAQKALLERKIQLITDLKRKQTVPVHILDQVSKNLPDFLWLSGMSAKGGQVTLNGSATSYTAISTFYNNLTGSGYFDQVDLGGAAASGEDVSFNLQSVFIPPALPEEQAEEAAPSGAEQPQG